MGRLGGAWVSGSWLWGCWGTDKECGKSGAFWGREIGRETGGSRLNVKEVCFLECWLTDLVCVRAVFGGGLWKVNEKVDVIL